MLNRILKRGFDIIVSLVGLIVLSPVFILIAVLIKLESKGGIVFKQTRVGKNNIDFNLYKFRSMFVDTEHKGQLTIGMRDPRITKIGYTIRKYKLDELTQLLNVLKGDMSLVGPRPEVRKYVALYNSSQLEVLSVKPGITDYASIKYFDENAILGRSANPEQSYIEEIMPEKLDLNLAYVKSNNLFVDFKIIMATFIRFFSNSSN
jgi:lipopolysaccharide/colanic/teichoic acid biosynthesis glycosyltransferase